MDCTQCGRVFASEDRAASISGSIMGDEYTEAYFLCPGCQTYSVAIWHDDFTGLETMRLSGPRTKAEGDEMVSLIRKCDSPWDKKCRCEAHRAYFGDALD